MRTVLAAVWLMALCLPVNAAEVVQRFDTNGDGQIDQWEYYEADVLTRLEKDRDYDERVDHWVTYQDGKAVRAEFDTNGSGKADQHEFYDADGALQLVTSDEDGDGNPDQWQTYEQGTVARIEYDQNGDGRPDQWEHFKPGSDEPYKVESDTTGDGKVDTMWEEVESRTTDDANAAPLVDMDVNINTGR
jgi:hypothetical protein